jgi:glycosyltransferase involved in cell wall biosynthesis
MKLSIYMALRDGIRHDYPYLESIRHHLPLADEIIVNEGYSTDGTYETLVNLDPKIKIFRTHWKPENGEDWWIHFKDAARRQCTGDWCLHLDSDEFIPEWEFERLRDELQTTEENLLPVQFVNFYGNYRVCHADPEKSHWITRKMIIHRNVPEIEFWGDGSNVRLKDEPFAWGSDEPHFHVHHFGGVRYPGRLRQAWWLQGRFRTGRSVKLRPPQWVFDLFPMKWADRDFMDHLVIYDGPLIKAVRDNPRRFARDKYELLGLVTERAAPVSVPVRQPMSMPIRHRTA